MEYTSEFDEVNEIIIIRVRGTYHRPEDSLTIQKLARDFYNKRGCCRFLIDMRQTQIVGETMDVFVTGSVPVDNDLRMKMTPHKVALVYSTIDVEERFLKNIAVNKGYNIRIFSKVDKAIEWLKKD